ncbi:MAG: single-stranded DNA-binding protein [Clostridiales Family XIII bacterium]|jgi:single-strand DNA-binding protein|nr:single-stranded DNA-binding protein [Clostridiales Family XIII bacterium]
MNSVNIIGRLTKDPEVKKTSEGLSICSFSLAVDDAYSKEDRADFIRVSVFGKQAENCKKYLRKGFMSGIQGRIRTRSYSDSEGVKRYPVEVVADRVQFLQWPDKGTAATEAPQVAEAAEPVTPQELPNEPQGEAEEAA